MSYEAVRWAHTDTVLGVRRVSLDVPAGAPADFDFFNVTRGIPSGDVRAKK